MLPRLCFSLFIALCPLAPAWATPIGPNRQAADDTSVPYAPPDTLSIGDASSLERADPNYRDLAENRSNLPFVTGGPSDSGGWHPPLISTPEGDTAVLCGLGLLLFAIAVWPTRNRRRIRVRVSR